jgi:hypothetical protein
VKAQLQTFDVLFALYAPVQNSIKISPNTIEGGQQKTYFLSMTSKILSIAERSLCYLQLLSEIFFLRVTVDIAAATHAALHIKTGGCFNQHSTTKCTEDVNYSYILFKCNKSWPIFVHRQ